MANKREFSLDRTRNIGMLAVIELGKTTTTERILYYTGKIYKIGETVEGALQMDWSCQEQERGMSMSRLLTTASWKDVRVYMFDTPGHVDSTIEVERLCCVLDGLMSVLELQSGVEPQTENVWRVATTYGVSRLVSVNKMDKIGLDFDYLLCTCYDRC